LGGMNLCNAVLEGLTFCNDKRRWERGGQKSAKKA